MAIYHHVSCSTVGVRTTMCGEPTHRRECTNSFEVGSWRCTHRLNETWNVLRMLSHTNYRGAPLRKLPLLAGLAASSSADELSAKALAQTTNRRKEKKTDSPTSGSSTYSINITISSILPATSEQHRRRSRQRLRAAPAPATARA